MSDNTSVAISVANQAINNKRNIKITNFLHMSQQQHQRHNFPRIHGDFLERLEVGTVQMCLTCVSGYRPLFHPRPKEIYFWI